MNANVVLRTATTEANKQIMESKSDAEESTAQAPYYNVILHTTLSLTPDKTREISRNLKELLDDELIGSCFREYGYVKQVHRIITRSTGKFRRQDLSCSVYYDVSFSCLVCRPQIRTTIICQIQSINNTLISLASGPIRVMIDGDPSKTAPDKFVYSARTGKYIYRISETTGRELRNGMYMKVFITSIVFRKKAITCSGILGDIANPDEIEHMVNVENSGVNDEADAFDAREFDER